MTVWIRETVRNLNSKVSSRPLPEPFQMTLRIDTRVHIYTYIYIFIGWRPGVGNLSSGNKFALTFIRYGLQFGDTHTHIYIIKREREGKKKMA